MSSQNRLSRAAGGVAVNANAALKIPAQLPHIKIFGPFQSSHAVRCAHRLPSNLELSTEPIERVEPVFSAVLSMRMGRRPPPVLMCERVVAYAVRPRSVRYSGHSYLFSGGKEVGPVSRLAICRDDEDGTFALVHCDRWWNSLGVAGGYRTLREAKARAERIYPGLMRVWKKTGVTRTQAKRYLDKHGLACGSCNKPWYKVERMAELGRRGDPKFLICDQCVEELHRQFVELAAASRT